jgi:prepilin-type N-terminal cleavage/methylation domain-containing protein
VESARRFSDYTAEEIKPRELPSDVTSPVWTRNQRQAVGTGVAYLYFFPQGYTEKAQLYVRQGDNVWTLSLPAHGQGEHLERGAGGATVMRTRRGFTLLETIIALAILSMALMAIVTSTTARSPTTRYSKKLTVATLLARSKMTDLEQKLYDEGFSTTTTRSPATSPTRAGATSSGAPRSSPAHRGRVPGPAHWRHLQPAHGAGGDDPMGGIASLFGAAGGGNKGRPPRARPWRRAWRAWPSPCSRR